MRKKAVIVLHSCWKLQEESLEGVMERVKKALCDKNPSVMGVSLIMFYDMIKYTENKDKFKDLIGSFVSILKQIIEHRLPTSYDYHRLPAPWLQIQLLELLSILGKDNQHHSEYIYEILMETMKRADIGIHIGFAVLYQCLLTAFTIYPNPTVIAKAVSYIPQFLPSSSAPPQDSKTKISSTESNSNLRCAGFVFLFLPFLPFSILL